jgi:hypothetical protein
MQQHGNRNGGRQFFRDRHIQKGIDVVESRRLIGDDPNCAGYHQPAGRAEESADYRIGHEANRAPRARKPQNAKQQAGQSCRQGHGDDDRLQQFIGALGYEAPDQGRRHCRKDHDGRTVRASYRKRKRAAQCYNCSRDGRRQERHRDPIGKLMLERAGKNQRGVRE